MSGSGNNFNDQEYLPYNNIYNEDAKENQKRQVEIDNILSQVIRGMPVWDYINEIYYAGTYDGINGILYKEESYNLSSENEIGKYKIIKVGKDSSIEISDAPGYFINYDGLVQSVYNNSSSGGSRRLRKKTRKQSKKRKTRRCRRNHRK